MKPTYLVPLLGLLFLSSCGKKDVEPTPSLLGDWTWVQTNVTHYSQPSGKYWYADTLNPSTQGASRMRVTGDSILQYQTTGIIREGYKRNGNTLNLKSATRGQHTLIIEELSTHRLVVRYEELPYLQADSEYSR